MCSCLQLELPENETAPHATRTSYKCTLCHWSYNHVRYQWPILGYPGKDWKDPWALDDVVKAGSVRSEREREAVGLGLIYGRFALFPPGVDVSYCHLKRLAVLNRKESPWSLNSLLPRAYPLGKRGLVNGEVGILHLHEMAVRERQMV